MNELMSPMHQKILALLILLLLILAFVNILVEPIYSNLVEKAEQAHMLENRLEGYTRVLAQKEALEQRLIAIQDRPLRDPFYYGDSDSDLNAQVQSDVRRLVERVGARIESMRSISITNEDDIYTVGLRMNAQMSMEALAQLLSQISAHNQLIELDNITIRTSQRQNGVNPPILEVEWDIIGMGILHMLPGGET